VMDPRQPEAYRQAEQMLPDKKVLGIKIHPTYHDYDILELGDELFAFAAERKAMVLMHPQHITQMHQLTDKYPDMKLMIAHLSSEEYIEGAKKAKHGNIYVDTSARGVALNHILEYAVEQLGSEKILFGTDTYAPSFAYPRVALADIPYEDKENILFKNALRLFPKAFR